MPLGNKSQTASCCVSFQDEQIQQSDGRSARTLAQDSKEDQWATFPNTAGYQWALCRCEQIQNYFFHFEFSIASVFLTISACAVLTPSDQRMLNLNYSHSIYSYEVPSLGHVSSHRGALGAPEPWGHGKGTRAQLPRGSAAPCHAGPPQVSSQTSAGIQKWHNTPQKWLFLTQQWQVVTYIYVYVYTHTEAL